MNKKEIEEALREPLSSSSSSCSSSDSDASSDSETDQHDIDSSSSSIYDATTDENAPTEYEVVAPPAAPEPCRNVIWGPANNEISHQGLHFQHMSPYKFVKKILSN